MTPVFKTAALIGLLAAGAAQAQTTTTPNAPRTDSPAPAAVSASSNPRTTAAPVAGANSFTEGQARARIADHGFSTVTDLKKDDQGVWRGTAQKDGKSVSVALDYQGNIKTN
jgi:protein CpxP